MNKQYKYIRNNFQFYETEALDKFLDQQAEKGYLLCGMFGRFANILKFKNTNCPSTQSHIIFCKHLDAQIDSEIETCTGEKICENIQFAVFRMPSNKLPANNTPAMEKQKEFMSISAKKSYGLIFALLLLFIIGFILKMFVAKTSIFLSFAAKCTICLTPALLFFLYLIGDLHDLKQGCTKTVHGCLYFTDRTRFKNNIFSFADLCVLLMYAASGIASLFIIFSSRDPVVLLELLRIWFCFFVMAYIFRLKYRNSYIYLLFVSAYLTIFI